jgi:hypothetical protein
MKPLNGFPEDIQKWASEWSASLPWLLYSWDPKEKKLGGPESKYEHCEQKKSLCPYEKQNLRFHGHPA